MRRGPTVSPVRRAVGGHRGAAVLVRGVGVEEGEHVGEDDALRHAKETQRYQEQEQGKRHGA